MEKEEFNKSLANAKESISQRKQKFQTYQMLAMMLGLNLPLKMGECTQKLEKEYGKSIEEKAIDLSITLNNLGKDKLKIVMLALTYCCTLPEMQAIEYKSGEITSEFMVWAGENMDNITKELREAKLNPIQAMDDLNEVFNII